MSPAEDMALIIVLPMTIAFWAWVVWIILEWRKMRHKSQLQNKIIEKFQSVQEFNAFLQSPEGDKFLDFVKFNGRAPQEKMLSSLSRGIVISTLGIALIVIGQIFPGEMKYFIAFGIVFIALGVGFLVSTFISYTLSKKWGIIGENN